MVSCHENEPNTEKDAKSEANFGKWNTTNSNFNSTNMTRFAYGIAANVLSVLLYGSNLVPVKKIETGDGMFFQWVNCASIWVVSMIGNLVLNSPTFYPLAMLGGFLWTTGNLAVVPIVKAVGLAVGVLIWGSASLMMGWASSRFGWFGITPHEVARPILNYCGVGMCLLSGLIFFFVKTDAKMRPNPESIPLLIDRRTHSGSIGPSSTVFWIDKIAPRPRQILGCLLAVFAGLLFGSSYVPILYIKTHSSCRDSVFHGASDYDLDYVFAECCGIFVTSTVYFAIYSTAMNNKPRVYSRVILPGLMTGVMWTLSTYSWFLACNYLSAVITFPIVTAGYGLVAGLWGSLVFQEIKGKTNFFIFLLGSCVVLIGSLLTAISKF
ncbi:transmembrane protein 144b [Antennarius striatus]|uniref:transmembrane protein 144b n=1 Tax=Antennarius striatus TaxID=241820 RepID=UPI0035ADFB24